MPGEALVPGLGVDARPLPGARRRGAAGPPRPPAGRRRPGGDVELCRLAPDPDLALAGVERFLDVAELPRGRDLLEALVLLTGSSRLATQALARDPGLLRRAARSPWVRRERPEASMRATLARAARRLDPEDVDGLHRLLRRFAAREVVRIALRDLRRARVDEVTGALSSVGTSTLHTAIAFHDRRLRARHGAPDGARGRAPGGRLLRHRHGQAGRPRAQLLVGHRPHLRVPDRRHHHRRARRSPTSPTTRGWPSSSPRASPASPRTGWSSGWT